MKKMLKKKRFWFLLIFILAYFARVIYVQVGFSGIGKEYYSVGDLIEERTAEFQLLSFSQVTVDELRELNEDLDSFFSSETALEQYEEDQEGDTILCMLTFTITNTTGEKLTYPIYTITLGNDYWYVEYDGTYTSALNEEEISEKFHMEAGETKEITFIYRISRASFVGNYDRYDLVTEKNWYVSFLMDDVKRMVLVREVEG